MKLIRRKVRQIETFISNNKSVSLVLLLIIILSSFLRLYKLGSIPPSLNWDETAAAYNAYTIKNWGRDEWGEKFPLVFTSFRDDKHPVHIYITSVFYLFFGVNDFVTRLPSAVLGIFMVILFFLFGKLYFKSNTAGLFSAFALSISPYAIHYSRGLWEAHFALFFLVLGLVLFRYGIKKKNYLILFSYLSFGLSLTSYHSSKIVIPLIVMAMTTVYIKVLLKKINLFITALFIFGLFVVLHIAEPRLLGLARIEQNKKPLEQVDKTFLYRKTNNQLLGQLEYSLANYKYYLSSDFLLKNGSQAPRGDINKGGVFLKTTILFAIIGIIMMLINKKYSVLVVLIVWFFIAPIPAVFAGEGVNSTRALFMLGPPEIAAGFGFAGLMGLLKMKYTKYILAFAVLILISLEAFPIIKYYFTDFSKNEAIQWQYGMKQAVEYAEEHPEYEKVYVTKLRNQPYIFFLYYLKYPLPKLLEEVNYNKTGSASYNTIESFGRYNFGNWNYIESIPEKGVLYIVTANEWSGFKYFYHFDEKKIIKFPNRDDAFYIVSAI